MDDPVDTLVATVASGAFFLILYSVLHLDILILGLVVVSCILFAKSLYLF